MNSFTLLIPTYNRPDLLERLLLFLVSQRAPFPIQIHDSSEEATRQVNRSLVRALALNLHYVEYPSDTPPGDKWQRAADGVPTPYAAFCADDDVVFVDAIVASVEFLEANRDYAACHGYYTYYNVNEHGRPVFPPCYVAPSIEGTTIADRVLQQVSRFQALIYAVFRREVLADSLALATQCEMPHYVELAQAVGTVMRGKVKRLERHYYVRNIVTPMSPTRYGNPIVWLSHDPLGVFEHYMKYRELVLTFGAETCEGPLDPQMFDISHAFYFGNAYNAAWFEQLVREEHGSAAVAAVAAARGPDIFGTDPHHSAHHDAFLYDYLQAPDARSQIQLGEKAFQMGDFDAATRAFAGALKQDPYNAEAWCNMGVVFHQVGEMDLALDALDKALELAPGNRDYTMNWAMVALAKGNVNQAIDAFEGLLRRFPNDSEIMARIQAITGRAVSD